MAGPSRTPYRKDWIVARIDRFGAVTALAVATAAVLAAAVLLSLALLWSPKAASAQVPAPANCATVPGGSIAAWWPWEGNGDDIKNGNTAVLSGSPAFAATGKVGQALRFDGTDDHAKASASPSLNVGAGNGLTIEAWIKPTSRNNAPLVEWNNGTGGVGTHLWVYEGGRLFANLKDTAGVDHTLVGSLLITEDTYQHVALTYDKASGQAKLYQNGTLMRSVSNLANIRPQTTYDLYFGHRPSGDLAGYRYSGEMDEIGIFDRALTLQEIQGIHNAGNASSPAGKCPDDTTPPSTTASATTADGNPYTAGDLTKSDVSINLTAEDAAGGWGVGGITYSATGGQTIAKQTVQGNSATLPAITQEGVTTVTYYATDRARNAETPEKTFVVNKKAPLVRSVSPVKGATNVALDTKPTATFWEQMKPETFTKANVRMTNMKTKKRVPAKLSCDDPCTTVTIAPSSVLERRTKYKVTILGGAKGPQNVAGIPMAKSEVWSFTTGRR